MKFLVWTKRDGEELIDATGGVRVPLDMGSLFIDDRGFLYHSGVEWLGGVGLIKSPGLAEELYARLNFDEEGEICSFDDNKPMNNSQIEERLKLLQEHNLLGNHIEPDL